MASEKAAAEFQLEKEVKRLQEAQVWTWWMLHSFFSFLYTVYSFHVPCLTFDL